VIDSPSRTNKLNKNSSLGATALQLKLSIASHRYKVRPENRGGQKVDRFRVSGGKNSNRRHKKRHLSAWF